MVDTDNAKSKRLSKCMGDKLDEEKGRYASLPPSLSHPLYLTLRSIEELVAPRLQVYPVL
jgi:hypothetical protein